MLYVVFTLMAVASLGIMLGYSLVMPLYLTITGNALWMLLYPVYFVVFGICAYMTKPDEEELVIEDEHHDN